MAEENNTHSDLFQPDESANEPCSTHGAEGGEPGDKKQFIKAALDITSANLCKTSLSAYITDWQQGESVALKPSESHYDPSCASNDSQP